MGWLSMPSEVNRIWWFVPSTHGSYTLHIEDENELENQRSYDLRLKPDPAPAVKLERPSPTRDSLSMLPTAEVPTLARSSMP